MTTKTPIPTPGARASGEPKYLHPSTKRRVTVGAFGGFIASIAFIGIMLWLPLIVS